MSRVDPITAGASEQPSARGDTGTTRRVTINDVAQAAGVSVSAVSKVMRDAYGVSPTMRSRVRAAVEQLGYRPNAGARAMRGRSYTVGVVLTDLMSPFQPEVAQGIADRLDDTRYQEVIVNVGSSQRQQRSIEALIDRQVDALVLVAPWLEVAWIEKLAETIPTVVIALHGPATTFDTIVHDHDIGARLVVDHLTSLGHERILHTSMPGDLGEYGDGYMLSHTARRLGFAEAMREHGLTPDVIETWFSEDGGHQAALEAFDRVHRPTAIFAGADIAALGVLRAAEERGLQVPEDLSVVGYDNIYTSTIKRISLTTVDQSGRHTGETSAQLLLERLDGRTEPRQEVLIPELIIRGTSGPPPRLSDDA